MAGGILVLQFPGMKIVITIITTNDLLFIWVSEDLKSFRLWNLNLVQCIFAFC